LPQEARVKQVAEPTQVHVSAGGDRITVVRIDRPPHNFLDTNLLAALADALDAVDADDSARVTVLCAGGKTFCGGANLSGTDGKADPAAFYGQALRLFRRVKPVVAAVGGAAVGGGLGLALAADFRIAAPEARFSANFARLGIHQGFGISVTLPELVGQQMALEMLLTGRRLTGEEARDVGLCDRLVSLEELEATALGFAAEIAASAPLAVESIRATMRGGLAERVAAAIEHESAEQAKLTVTSDFKEGVEAMTERRTPNFERR
jgi:enoyl-CoA hydratase/carnithine racemase